MDRQTRSGARGWAIWLLLLGVTVLGSQWTRRRIELPLDRPLEPDVVLHDDAPPRIVFPAEGEPPFEFELSAEEAP